MPELEIISINIWDSLISVCNLLLIFLILKKFLYKPVKKMMAQRQASVDEQYANAEKAENEALESKAQWEAKLEDAHNQADKIFENATVNASRRGDKIIAEAKEKADVIVRQAKTEAELELKKAEDGIKREIVVVSSQLAEKVINREINTDDHRELINSFIREIGESDDGSK